MATYSHSRLSTFEHCKLKYKYHYVDRIKVEGADTVEAFMGGLVHEAFEKLYRGVFNGKILPLKEVVAFYKKEWKKRWTKEIVINSKELKQADYLRIGEKCIKDYYAHYHPFDQGRVLGIETKDFVAVSPDVKMHARMDLFLQDAPGVYSIHDYKTYAKMLPQAHLDEDRQLGLYAIWVHERFKDAKQVRLVWHFLRFDKEMVSERKEEHLTELKKQIISSVHEIETEAKWEPSVSALCSWCEYQNICPQWRHKFKTEELPKNKYLKEEGVVLANTYAATYAKKKNLVEELDKELEQLQEAIVAYTKSKSVSVIFGSNHKVSVKEYDSVHAPAKGTKEREQLEKLLHDIKKWDDVTGLDVPALKKAVEEEKWPGEIIQKMKKFLEIEKSVRVSLGKKKD